MDEPEFFSSEEDPEQPLSDVKRRFTSIGRRLAQVASTVGGCSRRPARPQPPQAPALEPQHTPTCCVACAGGALARSAEAAAEVLTDADLRRRGAQAIADSASKGLRGLQQGLQTGATGIQRGLQTVQRGPKQIQAVLLRVQHQIEQQRMAALLEVRPGSAQDVAGSAAGRLSACPAPCARTWAHCCHLLPLCPGQQPNHSLLRCSRPACLAHKP